MDSHHSQKQKRNLLNLHPVVFRDIHSFNQPHRRLTPFVKRHFYNQRAFAIGLIATVGLSTAVVQALQYPPLASQDSKSNQPGSNSSQSITTHINTSTSPDVAPAPVVITNPPSNQSSQNNTSKSQVIINGENIPVPPNGTINRSYSTNNGQSNISVKIDNSSSSSTSSSSNSSVDIRSSSSSSSKSTNNTARGSP